MSDDYQRIPDKDYQKLMFQLGGQVTGILNIFNQYGQQSEMKVADHLLMQLCENFGMAVRGKKMMIHVIDKPLLSSMGKLYDGVADNDLD
jgi:hypothetical protein